MSRLRSLRRLVRAREGIAVTEFAILAPVMVMLLLGGMDIAYTAYAQAQLEGAMQKAGRDSGIEGASTASIDEKVKTAFKMVAPRATFVITRKAYTSFTNVRPERFTDTNGNGIRDAKECYDDVNGNQQWDADPGNIGQGGAGDVTLYTVSASYTRLFPIAKMFGWSDTETVTAQTLLKNQPYATQAAPTVVTRCN
jgi:Flp pilus assembly protein TadG